MTATTRRLERLEAEEWRRNLMHVAETFGNKSETVSNLGAKVLYILAAPTDAERHELVDLLETVFDDRGYVDRRRLTPEQQQRALALLDKARGEAA